MENSDRLYFGGSKISADGGCSLEINICLLLGRKAITNITLPTKVHLVMPLVSSVVMYGCESWIIKKAEGRRLMFLNCGVGEDS